MGRRLFDEPMLSGASDQRPFAGLQLNHFEETRSDEYSLDRLGRSGVERKIVAYLMPRAEAAGRTYHNPKPFNGWIVLPARELVNARKEPRLVVLSSPIKESEPNDNKYHAHVCRPKEINPYHMALHLRYLFTTYGQLTPVKRDSRFWVRFLQALPVLHRIFRGSGLSKTRRSKSKHSIRK